MTTLTSLFNDKLHITSVVDDRLKKLQDFYCFMTKWSVETKANKKQFVSDKLVRFTINVFGFLIHGYV